VFASNRGDHPVHGTLSKNRADVKIDHPVRLPAPPPTRGHRVERGTPRAIPIGVRMEDRLDLRLQLLGHHRLRDPMATVGIPSILVPAPCAFAISTARTGGGKYDPEDIRFQILYRLPCRSFSDSAIDCPSTPGAPCSP
jgi:hypothetical protein